MLMRAQDLRAEAAAAELADQVVVLGLTPSRPARRRRPSGRRSASTGRGRACRPASTPCRARLERMVRVRLVIERLVDDEVGFLEAGVEVADARLRVGQPRAVGRRALGRLAEVGVGPLRRFATSGSRPAPGTIRCLRVARWGRPGAGCRADRARRERLEVDLDLLDRIGRDPLVVGGDGEDRLPLVERLVGDAGGSASVAPADSARARADRSSREDRVHAGHRERGRCVDLAHAAVRHRATAALREQHAVGALVLGVARATGDLRVVVGRRVVGADGPWPAIGSPRSQRCCPPTYSAARIALFRILL